jgi:hypothetical protein
LLGVASHPPFVAGDEPSNPETIWPPGWFRTSDSSVTPSSVGCPPLGGGPGEIRKVGGTPESVTTLGAKLSWPSTMVVSPPTTVTPEDPPQADRASSAFTATMAYALRFWLRLTPLDSVERTSVGAPMHYHGWKATAEQSAAQCHLAERRNVEVVSRSRYRWPERRRERNFDAAKSRFIKAMKSIEMLFGQAASHSP